MLTALDDRIKVAAPIAGITDLENYVVDGTVEGHCDCMFFVNTYRWDYPLLSAMAAPKALMLGNSDKDRIFPLTGIERLHAKTRKVYGLNDADKKLALLITEGPHEDTQDLQLPVFRWFNRQLKQEDPVIEMAAKGFFQPEQLRVFKSLPNDAINARIHETFVPEAQSPKVPESEEAWTAIRGKWIASLVDKSFGGWPQSRPLINPRAVSNAEKDGMQYSAYDFSPHWNVDTRLYVLRSAKQQATNATVVVLNEEQWIPWLKAMLARYPAELAEEKELAGKALATNRSQAFTLPKDGTTVFAAPRGVGLSAWTTDEKKQTHIRRRFMLLGQTVDSMRVWDIRRAISATKYILQADVPVTVEAEGFMAANALYASMFESEVEHLKLTALPKSHDVGPDYLNVLRILDIPQALAIVGERANIDVAASDVSLEFSQSLQKKFNWTHRVKAVSSAR